MGSQLQNANEIYVGKLNRMHVSNHKAKFNTVWLCEHISCSLCFAVYFRHIYFVCVDVKGLLKWMEQGATINVSFDYTQKISEMVTKEF